MVRPGGDKVRVRGTALSRSELTTAIGESPPTPMEIPPTPTERPPTPRGSPYSISGHRMIRDRYGSQRTSDSADGAPIAFSHEERKLQLEEEKLVVERQKLALGQQQLAEQ